MSKKKKIARKKKCQMDFANGKLAPFQKWMRHLNIGCGIERLVDEAFSIYLLCTEKEIKKKRPRHSEIVLSQCKQ